MKIGEKIPDFSVDALVDGQIKRIKLHDYLGKWMVLIFYPADFSFVCPTELEDAERHYGEFKELGAEVFSVSTDTAYSHLAWHDTSPAISKISYPMIAGPAGKMCREFGPTSRTTASRLGEPSYSTRTAYCARLRYTPTT